MYTGVIVVCHEEFLKVILESLICLYDKNVETRCKHFRTVNKVFRVVTVEVLEQMFPRWVENVLEKD